LPCAAKNQPAASGIFLQLLLELVLCTLQMAHLIAQGTTSRAAQTLLGSPVFDHPLPCNSSGTCLAPSEAVQSSKLEHK